MGSRSPNLQAMRFLVEELVLFLCISEFLVERSKIILCAYYVGGRPLLCKQDDECVAKEFLEVPSSGGARLGKKGGRATSRKKGAYDCTMGFEGEDPATNFSATPSDNY